jgi:hypothetical protein
MSSAMTSSRFGRFLRAGPIMMGLGALLTIGGVVGTTASTNGGNQSCPSGTGLIAKFDYNGHSYTFSSPSGNTNVVTLFNADEDGGTWHSTLPVSYVLVKGGVNTLQSTIAPPKTDGTFSNQGLPLDSHHNRPDIDNVQFCGTVTSVTTTTKASTTTSSSTSTSTSTTVVHGTTTTLPTTTTCQCQTTTTHAAVTTTTQAPVTTTTHAPVTTTTCGCQTTTTHPVPPTTCECQTTTTHHTTTTVGETTSTAGATSTTVPGSTTSSSMVSGSTIVGATTTTVRTHHVTTTTSKSAAQGETTTFKPYVTVTTVLKPDGGNTLPFTGSSSTPLIALGIVLLATGLTLTLSQARRRSRA